LPTFSLVTINILNDLSFWKERGGLLAAQLAKTSPDLIAMQEVRLRGESSTAHWIVDQLNNSLGSPQDQQPYEVLINPRTGGYSKKEGIAVISRLPVKRHESLDLLTQNRVAQVIQFRVDRIPVLLVNVHFYWQPGISAGRQEQIELLLDFLDTQPVDHPVVVCGDFNGLPGTPAIERMRQYFDSAYKIVNKKEPEYSCPTPLPKSKRSKLKSIASWLVRARPKPDPSWQGTLDYIFVDPRLQTQDCQISLDQPSEKDPEIYPSDHFGLWATIKVTE